MGDIEQLEEWATVRDGQQADQVAELQLMLCRLYGNKEAMTELLAVAHAHIEKISQRRPPDPPGTPAPLLLRQAS